MHKKLSYSEDHQADCGFACAPRALGGCLHAVHTLHNCKLPASWLQLCSYVLRRYVLLPFNFWACFIMILWNMAFHCMSTLMAANRPESQKVQASSGSGWKSPQEC